LISSTTEPFCGTCKGMERQEDDGEYARQAALPLQWPAATATWGFTPHPVRAAPRGSPTLGRDGVVVDANRVEGLACQPRARKVRCASSIGPCLDMRRSVSL
jgi:hypothetical protein